MSVNVVGFLDLPASNLINADSSLFFTSFPGIWQTQGEETGISLVFPPSNSEEFSEVDIRIDGLQASGAVGGNGNLLFSASENEFGHEPWISDGTFEGTRILKDINTNGSSLTVLFTLLPKMESIKERYGRVMGLLKALC